MAKKPCFARDITSEHGGEPKRPPPFVYLRLHDPLIVGDLDKVDVRAAETALAILSQ